MLKLWFIANITESECFWKFSKDERNPQYIPYVVWNSSFRTKNVCPVQSTMIVSLISWEKPHRFYVKSNLSLCLIFFLTKHVNMQVNYWVIYLILCFCFLQNYLGWKTCVWRFFLATSFRATTGKVICLYCLLTITEINVFFLKSTLPWDLKFSTCKYHFLNSDF